MTENESSQNWHRLAVNARKSMSFSSRLMRKRLAEGNELLAGNARDYAIEWRDASHKYQARAAALKLKEAA